ncbi:hypothetical protein J6590_014635 [Homalodisca vitripennis]|nr:hypothetical protein J6590_014635 [Homalodisca vitripennis]
MLGNQKTLYSRLSPPCMRVSCEHNEVREDVAILAIPPLNLGRMKPKHSCM